MDYELEVEETENNSLELTQYNLGLILSFIKCNSRVILQFLCQLSQLSFFRALALLDLPGPLCFVLSG
jgi:hypothetical protein